MIYTTSGIKDNIMQASIGFCWGTTALFFFDNVAIHFSIVAFSTFSFQPVEYDTSTDVVTVHTLVQPNFYFLDRSKCSERLLTVGAWNGTCSMLVEKA